MFQRRQKIMNFITDRQNRSKQNAMSIKVCDFFVAKHFNCNLNFNFSFLTESPCVDKKNHEFHYG